MSTIQEKFDDSKSEPLSSDAGSDSNVRPLASIAAVLEAHDARFTAATASQPLNPWSARSFQLYAIFLIAYLNATSSGFDGTSDTPKLRRTLNLIVLQARSWDPLMPWSNTRHSFTCVFLYFSSALVLINCHRKETGSTTGILFALYTIGW